MPGHSDPFLGRQVRSEWRPDDLGFWPPKQHGESRVGLDDRHVETDPDHPERGVQDDLVQSRGVLLGLDQQRPGLVVRVNLGHHDEKRDGPEHEGPDRPDRVAAGRHPDCGQPDSRDCHPWQRQLPDVDGVVLNRFTP